MACPKPLVLTKKALGGLGEGQTLSVLIDNETSKQNVERFCRDNGVLVTAEVRDGIYTLTLRKPEQGPIVADEKAYCTPGRQDKRHVILFKSDVIGAGPPELGAILMKAFINTLKEVQPLPSHLVFFTTGVHLVLQGSAVLGALIDLEKMGLKVLVCGTCLDYFNVKDRLGMGSVSNMYTILETLTAAGSVIVP
jgi:selenium metabolism protein YedF